MSEAHRCPQCGGGLPADAPEGLCPECLLKARLETEASAPSGPEPEPGARSPGHFIPPSPAELAPQFPQLEILDLLGHGGMGAVYKARQPGLDRLVALKILPREVGADPAFAERFTREARALAKLSHPNIVAVYDFGQTPLSAPGRGAGDQPPLSPLGRGGGGEGPLYYFVMEYVDGVDLRRMLRAGHLQPRDALAIVPQVCEALQFAHDEGIVHRDIKPENILVDKRGRVKIADFGLAKLLGTTGSTGVSPVEKPFTLTGTGQVMGTWSYMAPEQIEHPQAVDHRADIYSLGVVFYEMLTGELPIGRFAPPSQKVVIDVRLDEVVLRALEKEPEQRYQHASEVKTEVELISSTLRPSGPSAAPAVEMPPSRRSLRRRAMLLVRLAAWTGLLVGLFGVGLPSAFRAWWPHTYGESWQISLAPQSGAYHRLWLGGKRYLYGWGWGGLHARDLIAKKPWTGIAKIELLDTWRSATLESDLFREEWRWTAPGGEVTRSRDEPRPESVAEWMKAAGIDITKPGVQEEAVELIRLVKEATSGLLPGGQRPVDYPESSERSYPSGIKIGPFTSEPVGGGLLTRTGQSVGLDYDSAGTVLVVVFLATWILGIRTIVRRHRRRLAAAHETERRYRLGTVGFWALVICLLGGLATRIPDLPWVRLIPRVYGVGGPGGALTPSWNWYGNVTGLTFLAVFLVCFVTDFFSRGRSWQPRIMVVAGAIVVAVTSILFWGLTRPVGLAAGRLTVAGSWHGVDVGTRPVQEGVDWVAKNIHQRSGPGLWIAFAMGLALLALGCLAIRRARPRLAESPGPAGEKELRSPAAAREKWSERRYQRAAEAVRTPADQVKGPATGLLVAGALAIALPFILIPASWVVVGMVWPGVRESLFVPFVFGGMAYMAAACLLGVMMILGGWSLKRFQSRWLSLTGSVIAVLPWNPAWLLGLPMGIWALMVQNRREVEEAFDAQTTDLDSLAQRIKALGTALFVTGAIGTLTAAAHLLGSVAAGYTLAPLVWINESIAFPNLARLYAVLVIPNVLVMLAGVQTRNRLSSLWATIGCVLAMLPLSLTWPLSLPIGIWALAILTRSDFRAAFADAEASK